MRLFQKSLVIFFTLIIITAHTVCAASAYERMSNVRIADQQTICKETITHRRKKRIIAATGTGIIAAASVSWFMYKWLKPDEQPTTSPVDSQHVYDRYKAAEAQAMQQFAEDWKKRREFKGAVISKMQDALALGLASALISLVLSKGSSAFNKMLPMLDSILPMSDIPLLIMALRRVVVNSRHYQRTMLLLLEHPTNTNSLAAEIAEKTKRFEHKQLIISLEHVAAWLACFANDIGEVCYQEAQSTVGTLIQITNNLATLYEQESTRPLEAAELINTLCMQIEQLTSLIVPVLKELGYEQE